ncbi:uncharacterized protein LOC8274674 isoform X2 [Ricinus communis]|uniref:Uncharacterized protein n=1 Tax=Ricinus communis TaxID=3988 RepID=B9R8A4_RICCO|nr:uncharacterized protein LOC8274674 isoform X2 [Ricinus communis]EEF52734.1 conserved hypothetical protein [Ricinus communis]|eukprot:XP_002510547.1 uncharacterized protein LOC8274674 isoform X2 [Ricinus communis]
MARLIRPLRQWPLLQHHCCSRTTTFLHLLSPSLLLSTTTSTTYHSLVFNTPRSSNRSVHFRSRGLRLPDATTPSDRKEGGSNSNSDSDSDEKRSRNQKKREARRAVRWGMELASFSGPQIKRILRMASLEREVYDALILVKRLGPDVREGKRRQFNYIGKLLREVKPELMDALIHSTKDGDWSRVQAVSDLETAIIEEADEDSEETDYDEEEEGSCEYADLATRWLDGLINKDIQITNEVYAISSIDFDRQELRKLVRRVHAVQEGKNVIEENKQEADTAVMAATKPLLRFLHALAKQMPTESI